MSMPVHDETYKACVTYEVSHQPAYQHSLITVFVGCLGCLCIQSYQLSSNETPCVDWKKCTGHIAR